MPAPDVNSSLRDTRAAGILYRAGGDILLLKRAADAGDYPGHWCFPGGGIEADETPEQAARRESLEEVGYQPDGEVRTVTEFDGFLTFSHSCDKFSPVLNDEHTGYVWARPDDLPQPIHPGVTYALKSSAAMDESARQFDNFGWMTIEDNPISKVGVFPYLGKQIGAPEPDRIYMVYRPAEELMAAETIESFKLTPFINEHPTALLGNVDGLVKTDNKRVEGVIGEKVYFEYPYLKANLRVYSAQTLDSIGIGKEEVSAGYLCQWSRESGNFEGAAYEYVQRNIRGNHSALVEEGRSGPDVSVMDSMTFNINSKELQMDLAELVKSVAALSEKMSTFQGAMDSITEKLDKDDKDDDGEGKKTAMDEDEDKNEKEKDKEKDDDKKGAGMDAAAFSKAVAAEVSRQLAAKAPAMDSAAMMADMSKKTDLANRLSLHLGTFAHDSMDHKAVAEYGAEKLGLDKTHAIVAVESYLKAAPAPTAYGMDSGSGAKSSGASFLAEQFK